ncbi:MAG: aminotransferase class IV [Bacteroidetes bacterium]|nr:aminotransferase class IV [Bacteroidota bacterium]
MFPYIIYNGQLLPSGDAFATADSRALRFGDGIFETMNVTDGRILFLNDHILRMQEGMRTLSLTLPSENLQEFVAHEIMKLLKANETDAARVRISLWRSGSGFYLPENNGSEILFTASQLVQKNYFLNKSNLAIGIFTGQQKSPGVLSNLKSLNSQLYVYAAIKGKEMGFDEMLICNNQGNIIESTSSCLFLVKDGVLVTPPLSDGCIAGVMRKNIIRIALHSGIQVTEKSITENDLMDADEIWLTNVIQGVRTVTTFNEKRYQNVVAAKMIAVLNDDTGSDS